MATIVNIKDYQFTMETEHEREENKKCAHKKKLLHEDGEYIICRDCGIQVSAFWALKDMLNAYSEAMDDFKTERRLFNQQCKEKQFLKILNRIDKAWSGKHQMAIGCPHCRKGILPEDDFGQLQCSAELERRERQT